jgi:hypothetical protein
MKLSDVKRYLLLGASLVAAAAGYTWYWHSTADRIMADIPILTEVAEQHGYSLVINSPETSGFPYRLIVTVPSVEFAPRSAPKNSRNRWRFRTADLVAYAQPWDLSHMILELGGPVSLLWNEQTHTATADRAMLSMSFDGAAVRRLSSDVRGLDLSGGGGASNLTAERVQAHLQRVDNAGGSHSSRVSLAAEGLTIPERQSGVLDPFVKLIRAEGLLGGWTLGFETGPSVDQWLSGGGALQLDDFEVSWPPIGIEGSGSLGLDKKRRPNGSIKARVRGHGALIDAFEEAGVLSLRKAATARAALGMLLTSQGDRAGRLPVTVELQDGRLYLGPVKLLRLPAF